MKHFKMKTLIAALAVAGLTVGCDRDDVRQDAYVPPEEQPIERTTTAPGTTDPSAVTSMENDNYSRNRAPATVSVDHEETVQFEGTALTDESEGKLEDLVEALDKDKPVAVIVAMEESPDSQNMSGQRDNIAPGTTNPAMNSTNTSTDAGAQSRDSGMAATGTSQTADTPESTTVFSQRVENVRQFLEEKGVEVVEWTFEDSADGQTLSGSTNTTPSATDGLATGGSATQPQEDVQQIRIVISGAMEDGGISSVVP